MLRRRRRRKETDYLQPSIIKTTSCYKKKSHNINENSLLENNIALYTYMDMDREGGGHGEVGGGWVRSIHSEMRITAARRVRGTAARSVRSVLQGRLRKISDFGGKKKGSRRDRRRSLTPARRVSNWVKYARVAASGVGSFFFYSSPERTRWCCYLWFDISIFEVLQFRLL